MTSLTIDSSVFISAWHATDIHHGLSQRFFHYLSENTATVILPELVLFEVTNTLNRLGLHGQLEAYLNVFEDDLITLLPLSQIYPTFAALPTVVSLKTADLIFCATASMAASTLISWDRQLVSQAAKLTPAMSPAQYLNQTNH